MVALYLYRLKHAGLGGNDHAGWELDAGLEQTVADLNALGLFANGWRLGEGLQKMAEEIVFVEEVVAVVG